MIPFAGWEMPAEYRGLSEEHLAVRTRAGLFDVSHMGQVEIAGAHALDALQWATSNDVSRLEPGQVHYSGLLTQAGTFVDDLLLYRLTASHFLAVVNAANVEKDVAWLTEQSKRFDRVAVLDTSSRYALIALQGPLARTIVQRVVNVDLAGLQHYRFAPGEIAGARGTVSRTGYTGEDGYEIFVPPQQAVRVWDAILEEGRGDGLIPAGLGARDTLRLEAAMRLYGNDVDESTSVLEADLEWIVGWGKREFLARETLQRQRAEGVTRRLVGFEMLDGAIARHEYDCYVGESRVGRVTSGAQTPCLERAIGMAYLPVAHTAPGTPFDIEIRGRRSRAHVVSLPFYKRPRG
jgi:aminomethyltransferase